MRKISADYIFPISSTPIKNGIIIINDKGIIEEVIDPKENTINIEDIEYHEGFICPGFINAHCHLELSHLKNKISPKKGLDHFIKNLVNLREVSPDIIQDAIVKAENEMIINGIVAVGDICNENYSLLQKKKGNLKYYNFIEVYGFHPKSADVAFAKGIKLFDEFLKISNDTSITAHAPYSASVELLKKINACAGRSSVLSMHNQESDEENNFFISKQGSVLDRLKYFGIETDFWQAAGSSSVTAIVKHFSPDKKLQLVHNTYTSPEDVEWVKRYSSLIWWCFCPKANLYIENKLPNIQYFVDKNLKITVGTDSLASNWGLSILEELKIIARHFPISLEKMLGWATINGAELLGFDSELGTLEKGKKPGLNLIKEVNPNTLHLTDASHLKVLY